MKRVITAVVLVPFALYAVIWAPPWLFFGAICALACICFHEYATITKTFAPLGYVAGLLFLALSLTNAVPILVIVTALAAMSTSLWADDLKQGMERASMLLLGILYVFGSWSTAASLHNLNPYWLLFGLTINWVGDSGAFYVGKNFGKHKLAPKVSPGKTWEGTIGGAALTVVYGAGFVVVAKLGVAWWMGGLLALLCGSAGQLGDLAESALKRAYGVKDSGTILPGHGGALDRMDSSLFSMPALLAFLNLFGVTPHPSL